MADPTTVSGLRGRWRASTISSPPADGAALQTWTETDGSSNADATQATSGNRPVYRSSGAFRPNSKTVVEFSSASSQYMTATLAQNTATTRFMVVRFKTLPNANMTITSSPLQVLISLNEKVTTAVEGVTFLVGDNAGTAVLVTDTWYVISMSDNGSNSNITYVNGTQDATSSTAHTNSGTSLVIGSKVSPGEYLNGYVAEVLDYNSVLSAGDRATVHSYLQDEYGVTVSDYVSSNPVIDLSFVASSAWVAPASSATVAPTYPAGIQAGDVVYAELVIKPDTATVATPTNWSLVTASPALGSGAQGAGTGPVKVHLYKRVASSGHTGTETFTITGGSSPVACMRAFRPQAGATDVAFAETTTSYSRGTTSTTFGGTGAANLNVATDDALVYISASADDQSTTHTISALAATGATLGSVTQSPSGTIVNAQGNDISAAAAYALCTAGTSSAAPSSTVTGSTTETGGGFFYRVRATGIAVTTVTGVGAGSFTFTGAAAGVPTKVGSTVAPFTFGATASGVPVVVGAATGSFNFTGTASGVPVVVGSGATSLGFTGAASGNSTTPPVEGLAVAAFSFAGTASGVPIVVGAATGAFTFGATSAGVPNVVGSSAAPLGFTATAAGVPVVVGQAVSSLSFTGQAAGVPAVVGQAVGGFGFTGQASGVPTINGQAIGGLGFAGQASGVPTVQGAGVGGFGFSGAASGNVIGSITGSGLGGFTFGATASGVPVVVGSAVGTLGFDAAAAGAVTVLGQASAGLGYVGLANGAPFTPVPVQGVATSVLGFTATAAGTPIVVGASAEGFGFAGTADGIVGKFGQASAELVFGGAALGSGALPGPRIANPLLTVPPNLAGLYVQPNRATCDVDSNQIALALA